MTQEELAFLQQIYNSLPSPQTQTFEQFAGQQGEALLNSSPNSPRNAQGPQPVTAPAPQLGPPPVLAAPVPASQSPTSLIQQGNPDTGAVLDNLTSGLPANLSSLINPQATAPAPVAPAPQPLPQHGGNIAGAQNQLGNAGAEGALSALGLLGTVGGLTEFQAQSGVQTGTFGSTGSEQTTGFNLGVSEGSQSTNQSQQQSSSQSQTGTSRSNTDSSLQSNQQTNQQTARDVTTSQQQQLTGSETGTTANQFQSTGQQAGQTASQFGQQQTGTATTRTGVEDTLGLGSLIQSAGTQAQAADSARQSFLTDLVSGNDASFDPQLRQTIAEASSGPGLIGVGDSGRGRIVGSAVADLVRNRTGQQLQASQQLAQPGAQTGVVTAGLPLLSRTGESATAQDVAGQQTGTSLLDTSQAGTQTGQTTRDTLQNVTGQTTLSELGNLIANTTGSQTGSSSTFGQSSSVSDATTGSEFQSASQNQNVNLQLTNLLKILEEQGVSTGITSGAGVGRVTNP